MVVTAVSTAEGAWTGRGRYVVAIEGSTVAT